MKLILLKIGVGIDIYMVLNFWKIKFLPFFNHLILRQNKLSNSSRITVNYYGIIKVLFKQNKNYKVRFLMMVIELENY